ncbi:MAG: hydrolase [Acidobacteria bacterium]|mgnify:FL=1|nr:hydrolase [Acidobacteriota bacterium]
MDPITHTLVGASLAETRLRHLTPLAAVTLILGANAPDIDAIAMFLDRDTSLHIRRGWTHGVLGIAILPLILAGLMVGFDRLRRMVGWGNKRPVVLRSLLVLAYLSVWSHPMLDWLNTYGIRLLMPFEDRWFYGDAIFIIDPWIWLMAASAVVFAHTRSATSVALWVVVAIASSVFVLNSGLVPAGAKIVWSVSLGCLVGIRIWRGAQLRTTRIALNSLLAILFYAGSMVVGSRVARSQAQQWLDDGGIQASEVMAGPVPANPFARDVVVQGTDRYYFLRVDWLAAEQIRPYATSIAIGDTTAVVKAALTAPKIQGTRHWLRFPIYEVNETPNGYQVLISDARFSRRLGGLGAVRVDLDQQLNVK